MKNRALLAIPLMMGLLLLPLGCGGDPTGPVVLQPDELCSGQPDAAIATFVASGLEDVIRAALRIGDQDDLTCGLVSGLTMLDASGFIRIGAGGRSLVGIHNLKNLTELHLRATSEFLFQVLKLTDISPLSGLTNLTTLDLGGNSISDISALRGLTSLMELTLSNNTSLTDIQPLLDNTGLGAGDGVSLWGTGVSCTDVAALKAKGVDVGSDCP